MAEHGSGKSNYAFAGWIWQATVAVLVIVTLVIGWNILATRNAEDLAGSSCPDGDFVLHVWADPSVAAGQLKQLQEQFNASHTTELDYCILANISQVQDVHGVQILKSGKDIPDVWAPATAKVVLPDLMDHVTAADLRRDPVSVLGEVPLLALKAGPGAPPTLVKDELAVRAADVFLSFARDVFQAEGDQGDAKVSEKSARELREGVTAPPAQPPVDTQPEPQPREEPAAPAPEPREQPAPVAPEHAPADPAPAPTVEPPAAAPAPAPEAPPAPAAVVPPVPLPVPFGVPAPPPAP